MSTIVAFTLRVLGGVMVPKFKVTLKAWVDGIPVTDAIRVGDLLSVSVTCERLDQ